MDRAQFQKMMEQRLKERLGINDEEWKVIGPLVTQVTDKQRELRGGMRVGLGRRGGRRRGGDNAAKTRDDKKAPKGSVDVEALQKCLESADSSAKDIQTKLVAVRAIRTAKETELKTVRDALRQVITVRQEAQLVLMGILD